MDTQDLLQIRSDPQHFAGSVLGIVRSDPMKTLFTSGRHNILDIIFYGWIWVHKNIRYTGTTPAGSWLVFQSNCFFLSVLSVMWITIRYNPYLGSALGSIRIWIQAVLRSRSRGFLAGAGADLKFDLKLELILRAGSGLFFLGSEKRNDLKMLIFHCTLYIFLYN